MNIYIAVSMRSSNMFRIMGRQLSAAYMGRTLRCTGFTIGTMKIILSQRLENGSTMNEHGHFPMTNGMALITSMHE